MKVERWRSQSMYNVCSQFYTYQRDSSVAFDCASTSRLHSATHYTGCPLPNVSSTRSQSWHSTVFAVHVPCTFVTSDAQWNLFLRLRWSVKHRTNTMTYGPRSFCISAPNIWNTLKYSFCCRYIPTITCIASAFISCKDTTRHVVRKVVNWNRTQGNAGPIYGTGHAPTSNVLKMQRNGKVNACKRMTTVHKLRGQLIHSVIQQRISVSHWYGSTTTDGLTHICTVPPQSDCLHFTG